MFFWTQAALAVAPSISSAAAGADRHPSAVFSAPTASSVTVYMADKPDQSSDGTFFNEAIRHVDFLTADEIASGTWKYEDQLDPGTYYLLLKATPSFTPCYISGGTYNPACANGFSNVVSFTVPTPSIRYSVIVNAPKFWTTVQLKFKATPLGVKQAYRACFKARSKRTICVHHVLPGYSWNSKATDYMNLSKHNLPRRAAVTWYVGHVKVLKKTFLVQQPA